MRLAAWILALSAFAVVVPAVSSPSVAHGQAAPTNAQRQKAREAYGRGQALFAEGKYVEAKVAFDEAYAALPNPVVLVSIGEAQSKLGELSAAVATFERYLAERKDAPDRADVEKKIAALKESPAKVRVSSDPEGAQIYVDGKNTDFTTPATIDVSAGAHTFEARIADAEPATQSVTAELGGKHEVFLVLNVQPAAQPKEPLVDVAFDDEEEPSDSGSSTAALWVTGGIGAAGIIAGSVVGVMALSAKSDYDADPTKSNADSAEQLALFSDVAFGVGAMALVTCAVIYLTGDYGDDSTAQNARAVAGWKITPQVAAHGAALSAAIHF